MPEIETCRVPGFPTIHFLRNAACTTMWPLKICKLPAKQTFQKWYQKIPPHPVDGI